MTTHGAEIRELTADELDFVSGGGFSQGHPWLFNISVGVIGGALWDGLKWLYNRLF